MEKPTSLRAAIKKNITEFADHPETLTMYVVGGEIVCHKHTLSHRQEYELVIDIADFTGSQDKLNIVILQWAQTHQPDILGPAKTGYKPFSFEVDILDDDKVNIGIKLKLWESVKVMKNEHGHLEIKRNDPPQLNHDLNPMPPAHSES